MSGLSIFLCPIAAILTTDYWLVKKRNIDVPSLYRRHARLAKAVNPSISVSAGIEHVYDMNYLYGFTSASFLYWSLSYFWPAKETLLAACIYEDLAIIDGVEYKNDGVHTPQPVVESEVSSETKWQG
ncbi:hypothetical protein LTR65_009791 [Meristemomyces frigidus]